MTSEGERVGRPSRGRGRGEVIGGARNYPLSDGILHQWGDDWWSLPAGIGEDELSIRSPFGFHFPSLLSTQTPVPHQSGQR